MSRLFQKIGYTFIRVVQFLHKIHRYCEKYEYYSSNLHPFQSETPQKNRNCGVLSSENWKISTDRCKIYINQPILITIVYKTEQSLQNKIMLYTYIT